jgi:hypothetical protein
LDFGLDGKRGGKSGEAFGLLICTLISENQGLEKLRYVSNLFQVYGINLAFFKVET